MHAKTITTTFAGAALALTRGGSSHRPAATSTSSASTAGPTASATGPTPPTGLGKAAALVAVVSVAAATLAACGSSGGTSSGSSSARDGHARTTTGVALPSVPLAATFGRSNYPFVFSVDHVAAQVSASKGDSSNLNPGSYALSVTIKGTASLTNKTPQGRSPAQALLELVPIYKPGNVVCTQAADSGPVVTIGKAKWCGLTNDASGNTDPASATGGVLSVPSKLPTTPTTVPVGHSAQAGTRTALTVQVPSEKAFIAALVKPDGWMLTTGDYNTIKTISQGHDASTCHVPGQLAFSDGSAGAAVASTTVSC